VFVLNVLVDPHIKKKKEKNKRYMLTSISDITFLEMPFNWQILTNLFPLHNHIDDDHSIVCKAYKTERFLDKGTCPGLITPTTELLNWSLTTPAIELLNWSLTPTPAKVRCQALRQSEQVC